MSEYKRLTNNNLEGYDPEYDFCIECKYFGEPNGCNRPNGTCDSYDRFMETYSRLVELEDKIENGTLIELPCKVGDTVWYIKSYGFGRYQVEDTEVAGFNFSKYENAIWVVGKYEEQLSKIYKTREEAEKRLNEIQNGSANY